MPHASDIYSPVIATLFDNLERMCEGAVAVDVGVRVQWLSDKYRRLLGIPDDKTVEGCDIEEIIPESKMREVVSSGNPIFLDIMRFGNRHFVVTRIPLKNEAGLVIGAVGFVLYDQLDQLQPLLRRFEELKTKLDATTRELGEARQARYSFASIIGQSPPMLEVKSKAKRAASVDSPVLICGETGTGKELLAQAIHTASPRRTGPFVAVNVAAIPETLVEAEFFGVAPGAFTGADRRHRKGKFEIANGGTLFLDEIGDLPVHLQSKLLRTIQEGEIEPVGSNTVQKIDARIITATNRDLQQSVRENQFRSDLLYRLNVLPLNLPPLRGRVDDIPALTEVILEAIARRWRLPLREIEPAALALLQAHRWPGNVRELSNVLERACLLTDSRLIGTEDIKMSLPQAWKAEAQEGPSLPDAVAKLEQDAIRDALKTAGGSKSLAAKILGISRSQLYVKLAALGPAGQRPPGSA